MIVYRWALAVPNDPLKNLNVICRRAVCTHSCKWPQTECVARHHRQPQMP
jgi:hypothetical protein